jgi:hypothetical protein
MVVLALIEPATVALLQLVSSSVLALTTAIIAGTALSLNYRQNYGWKPVVLVGNLSNSWDWPDMDDERWAKEPHAEDRRQFSIEFEVWNRRKYPVSVKGMTIAVANSIADKQ